MTLPAIDRAPMTNRLARELAFVCYGLLLEAQVRLGRPIVVAFVGPAGSGKSTLVQLIFELANGLAEIVEQDNLLLAPSDRGLGFLGKYDKDETLAFIVEQLIAGHSINVPVYDKSQKERVAFKRLKPAPMILVEGVLALHGRHMRRIADLSFWLNADDEIRVQRQVRRSELDGIDIQFDSIGKSVRYRLKFQTEDPFIRRQRGLCDWHVCTDTENVQRNFALDERRHQRLH
jgi:uridine kinase